MATTSDIRNGLCIKFKDGLWQIIEFLHVKPGKGPAFVRTKLKNLENGKIVDNTFNAGMKIETVRIETRNYQYLYQDEMGYHFMNSETYEQVPVAEHLINAPKFLKDGIECKLVEWKGSGLRQNGRRDATEVHYTKLDGTLLVMLDSYFVRFWKKGMNGWTSAVCMFCGLESDKLTPCPDPKWYASWYCLDWDNNFKFA